MSNYYVSCFWLRLCASVLLAFCCIWHVGFAQQFGFGFYFEIFILDMAWHASGILVEHYSVHSAFLILRWNVRMYVCLLALLVMSGLF